MPENHSRAGKPVERCIITDEPHDRYSMLHPYTGERLKHGIPILINAPNGKVIRKDVKHYKVLCPECKEFAEYNHDSEPVCPECGMICCGDDSILEEQLVRDAKAAGRIDGSSTGDSTA